MNYSEASLQEAAAKEKTLKEFFFNVKHNIRQSPLENSQHFQEEDRTLQDNFNTAREEIHSAFCDNFDYPTVLDKILGLVAATNKYMEGGKKLQALLLEEIAVYVDWILDIFGVKGASFGFTESGGGDNTEKLAGVLDGVTSFRDKVRSRAQEVKDVVLLKECDLLRDDTLAKIGIRLEDKQGQPTAWKIDDPEELKKEKKEKEEKETKTREKKSEGLKKTLENKEKELKKWLSAEVGTPGEFFKDKGSEYGEFGPDGFPTKTKDGKVLTKSQSQKAKKLWEKQKSLNESLQKKVQEDPSFITKLKKEVEQLKGQTKS